MLKLLSTNEEFVFVTDVGEELKHIVLVSNEMKNMNRTNEKEHKGMIEEIDLIILDNTITKKIR